MHYRVAIQVEDVPAWKWKSSVLGSLNLLLMWLQYFRIIPVGRLRIFVSESADALNTQLVPAQDQALWATSVPMAQFLLERQLAPSIEAGTTEATGSAGETYMAAGSSDVPAPILSSEQPDLGKITSVALEKRREELEGGAGGDHDCPYHFSLPPSMLQVHTWVQLWMRVQHGDLQWEAVHQ
jgi:hypothetical protein